MASLSLNSSRLRTPSIQFQFQSQSNKQHISSNFSTKIPVTFTSSQTLPKLRHFLRPRSVSSESSLSTQKQQQGLEEEEEDEDDDDPTVELCYLDPETDLKRLSEWELDFCSRPILDIRGKKVWELVVCDESLSLQYTKYFPNNVINSVTLKEAIQGISDQLGLPLPEKIRYFRSFNFIHSKTLLVRVLT